METTLLEMAPKAGKRWDSAKWAKPLPARFAGKQN
jgi:hypothetical protein